MVVDFLTMLPTLLVQIVGDATFVTDRTDEKLLVGRLRAASRGVCLAAGQGRREGHAWSFHLPLNDVLNRHARFEDDMRNMVVGTVELYRRSIRLLTPRRAVPKRLARRREEGVPWMVQDGSFQRVVEAAHNGGPMHLIRVVDFGPDADIDGSVNIWV